MKSAPSPTHFFCQKLIEIEWMKYKIEKNTLGDSKNFLFREYLVYWFYSNHNLFLSRNAGLAYNFIIFVLSYYSFLPNTMMTKSTRHLNVLECITWFSSAIKQQFSITSATIDVKSRLEIVWVFHHYSAQKGLLRERWLGNWRTSSKMVYNFMAVCFKWNYFSVLMN